MISRFASLPALTGLAMHARWELPGLLYIGMPLRSLYRALRGGRNEILDVVGARKTSIQHWYSCKAISAQCTLSCKTDIGRT